MRAAQEQRLLKYGTKSSQSHSEQRQSEGEILSQSHLLSLRYGSNFFPSSWAQPLIKFQEVSKGTDREKAKATQAESKNTSLLRRGPKDNKLGHREKYYKKYMKKVFGHM